MQHVMLLQGRSRESARFAGHVPLERNKDTLYRIHGTNEPWTIGTNVSSGCIRLTNEDIVDLYNRTLIGAKVIVFGTGEAAVAGQ